MMICASGFMSGFCNFFIRIIIFRLRQKKKKQRNASSNRLTSKKERYSIAVSGIPSNGNGVCTGITGGVASPPGVCTGGVGFPSSGISVGNTGSDGMICAGVTG